MAIVIRRFVRPTVSSDPVSVSGTLFQDSLVGTTGTIISNIWLSDYLSIGISGSGVPSSGINILNRIEDFVRVKDVLVFTPVSGTPDSVSVSDSLNFSINYLVENSGFNDSLIVSDGLSLKLSHIRFISDSISAKDDRLIRGVGVTVRDALWVTGGPQRHEEANLADNVSVSGSVLAVSNGIQSLYDEVILSVGVTGSGTSV
jgi:hypothetical protein